MKELPERGDHYGWIARTVGPVAAERVAQAQTSEERREQIQLAKLDIYRIGHLLIKRLLDESQPLPTSAEELAFEEGFGAMSPEQSTFDDFETQVRGFSQKFLTLAKTADDTLTAEIAQEWESIQAAYTQLAADLAEDPETLQRLEQSFNIARNNLAEAEREQKIEGVLWTNDNSSNTAEGDPNKGDKHAERERQAAERKRFEEVFAPLREVVARGGAIVKVPGYGIPERNMAIRLELLPDGRLKVLEAVGPDTLRIVTSNMSTMVYAADGSNAPEWLVDQLKGYVAELKGTDGVEEEGENVEEPHAEIEDTKVEAAPAEPVAKSAEISLSKEDLATIENALAEIGRAYSESLAKAAMLSSKDKDSLAISASETDGQRKAEEFLQNLSQRAIEAVKTGSIELSSIDEWMMEQCESAIASANQRGSELHIPHNKAKLGV